jgi:D-alanyl-D-alanine carboxypeptidase
MNKVDNILANQVKGHKTPSVQYAIFDKDKVIHAFRSGLADVKNQRKVNEQTTYHAYSITKTFTALAILQLAEQGTLDIDHSAKKYLPGFPYSPDITIRQLMTHSAGIPNPIPLSWIHLASEHNSFDRDRFFAQIFRKHNKTSSKPNEKFSYSNLGYVLLGQLIEQVTESTYEQYIYERILKKIDLHPNELGFIISDVAQHAKGYHKWWSFLNLILGFLIDKSKYMDKREGPWKPFKNLYVNGPSYGGLIGTPAAFVKYIQELLRPGSSLISPDYKKMLFTENHTADDRPTGMCLSWFKGALNDKTYFAHSGGGGGYYCELRIYPDQGIGSVVMFNRTGLSDERFLDKLDRAAVPLS